MKNMLLYPSNNDFMLKYSRQVIILKHNLKTDKAVFTISNCIPFSMAFFCNKTNTSKLRLLPYIAFRIVFNNFDSSCDE